MGYEKISPLDENQFTENELPVFYIHPKPVSKDFYSPVTLTYMGKNYQAEGKIRGGISSIYPKRSYTLKFPDDNLFNAPDKGFEDRKKIVLLSNFDDNSYIRNRLAYSLWNKMDNTFKINTYSSQVYTNGEYEGLYTIVDFINDNYVERNGFNPEGELYKASTYESDFYLHDELNTGFDKKTGYPTAGYEGADTILENFILFINNSNVTTFNKEFDDYANIQSYYDWWFFTSLLSAGDSTTKNSYHFHEQNGKWHYIPWDFNESFGQDWNTKRRKVDFDPENHSINGIYNRLVMNPEFSDVYDDRYKNLLQTSLHKDEIMNEIDVLFDEVRESAYKDYSKWSKKYKHYLFWIDRDDYYSVDEEIEYIKNWITDQYNLADNYYN